MENINPPVRITNSVNNNAKLHRLAANNTNLYVIATTEGGEWIPRYIYTDKAAALEDIKPLEANDREAGVFEPGYYEVEEVTKYFA